MVHVFSFLFIVFKLYKYFNTNNHRISNRPGRTGKSSKDGEIEIMLQRDKEKTRKIK